MIIQQSLKILCALANLVSNIVISTTKKITQAAICVRLRTNSLRGALNKLI